MIVTVKAWLHADLDMGSDDMRGTVYRLNSFSSPLTANSVVIRECSFEMEVPDGFDREKIAAQHKDSELNKQIRFAEAHLESLKRQLGEA